MISIIVPIYNSERYLSLCVNSLLSQTYKDIEVILVDDGSTDASSDICDSFKDERIKVIHKENGGISSARNVGLEIAKGEWVTFCDNDDVVDAHWLERMYKQVERYADVLPICAYVRDKSMLGVEIDIDGIIPERLYHISDYWLFYKRQLGGMVWNALFRKDIIDSYNIRFPERKNIGDINEDLVFDMSYIPHIKNIVYTGYADYLWKINETNHSSETTERWYFEKYEEKYRLLRDWMNNRNSSDIEDLATFYLYFFINAICTAEKYSQIRKYVYNDAVQECVRLADCTKENPEIIKFIKKKAILPLYIKIKLSNLIKTIRCCK